jgi:flagellar hook-associated protein 2
MSAILGQGTISVDGAVTGLKTSTLISELTSVISGSRRLMQQKVAGLEALSTQYTTLNTRLNTLDTALTAIDTAAEFREFSVATQTSASYSLTAAGNAIPGSYDILVSALAKAQVDNFAFSSSSLSVGGSTTSMSSQTDGGLFSAVETITISVNGTDTDIEVDTDTTLSGLAGLINQVSGVTAYVVQTSAAASSSSGDAFSLIVQSDDTGLTTSGAQRIALTSSEGSLSSVQSGQNSVIRVGGASGNTITSSSNTITAIQGLTITAESVDASNDYTSTVSLDSSAMAAKVSAVVDAFNGIVSFVGTNSITTSSGTNQSGITVGTFVGESTPRMVVHRLRGILSADYGTYLGRPSGVYTDSAVSSFNQAHRTSLSQMGVSTQQTGLLTFNSSAFTTALNSYQTDVESIFSATTNSTGQSSFAAVMRTELNAFVDPLTGVIDQVTDAISEEIDDLNDSIAYENTRITRYSARLQTQFNALETLTSKFNTTSSFLTSFFAPKKTS